MNITPQETVDAEMADTSSHPLFTIITVTYNAQNELEPTMRSVAQQTCTLYEHLIIDGASSDATLDIAERMRTSRTRIFSQPDSGIYHAMNRGIDRATGDYLIFLNAGDRFHAPDTLQIIADTIMNNDYPGVVYGETDIVNAQGQKVADRHLKAPEQLRLDDFKHGMMVCHQAFIAYRKVVGYYSRHIRYSADYEWCIRCLQHARRVVNTHATLIDYLSEGMTTRHRRQSLWERFKIMRYYYGTLPTIWRHIKFIPRFLRRRKVEKQFTQQ